MAKMRDVAESAGVSLKTVSRVLNNEPHVQEAVRKRVRDAAKTLGYVPSTSARSLRSKRNYTVQFITHTEQSTYVHAIQAGALKTCQEAGYQLAVSLIDETRIYEEGYVEEQLRRMIEGKRPDGVLLVAPLTNHPEAEAILSKLGVSVARIGPNSFEEHSGITYKTNEQEAARSLTKLLIAAGHKRIGFVRGPKDQNATEVRYRGFVLAMEEAGLPVEDELLGDGDFMFDSGREAGTKLLKLQNPPTAIFASNDDMASGVIAAAHILNITMPDDLSVVGFDDAEIAGKVWPTLTTVRQPVVGFGAAATRELIDGVVKASREPVLKMLDYSIVERGSVSAPRD